MPAGSATSERVESELFDVWNEVPLVPQSTGMSCWAAAAAMLIGWRDRVPVDPQEVAEGAGHWRAFRDGLHPSDVTALARTWGLIAVPDGPLSLGRLRHLLQQHGPLWMGEASPGLHSIVVTGIRGNGEPEESFVRINDPWPVHRGERYSLTFGDLQRRLAAATNVAGAHPQLLHTGGRGTGGAFRSRSSRSRRVSGSGPNKLIQEVSMNRFDWTHGEYESYPAHGSASALAAGVAAGEADIDTRGAPEDPLAGHGGDGANLCLRWNEMPSHADAIDVVVHLHGYTAAAANEAMLRDKVQHAGLEIAPPRGARAHPTLVIVPRGRKVTADEMQRHPDWNPRRYTFDALVRGGGRGMEALVAFAKGVFERNTLGRTSGQLSIRRLIFTAHSGGGSPLNTLLGQYASQRACNPDEVHVFDALYGNVDGLTSWVRVRIAQDRARIQGLSNDAARQVMREKGGSLRLVYRNGTRASSEAVATQLPAANDPLRAWYRAELTTLEHGDIPGTLGAMLLADAAADVPKRARAMAFGSPESEALAVAPVSQAPRQEGPTPFAEWSRAVRVETAAPAASPLQLEISSFPKVAAATYRISTEGQRIAVIATTSRPGERVFGASPRGVQVTTQSDSGRGGTTEGFRPRHVGQKATPVRISDALQVISNFHTRRGRSEGGARVAAYDEGLHVFAPDTRFVFNETAYPWSACGHIPEVGATGAMVGPRHMLTVSHGLNYQSGALRPMSFVPLAFDGSAPYGRANVIRVYYWFRTTDASLTDDEIALDYAVCVLDRKLGDTTGWLGSRVYSNSWDGGAYWAHVGYPIDIASGQRPVFHGPGTIDSTSTASHGGQTGLVMSHKNDIEPGDSGGPFFGWWSGKPYIIGVQSGHDSAASPPFTPNVAAGGSPLVELIRYALRQDP